MSNMDPHNDINRTAAGNPGGAPEPGTAQVHTRVTGGQGSRDRDELGFARGGSTDASDDLATRARETARGAWNDAQEQAEEWTEQASEMASRARDEARGLIDRAETQLEQSGVMGMVRQHPLAAAGLAFGVGYLLAGSGSKRRRSGIVGRAGGQLRSALVGSVSTMLMHELQEMLDEHGGPVGLFNSLTSRGDNSSTTPSREHDFR